MHDFDLFFPRSTMSNSCRRQTTQCQSKIIDGQQNLRSVLNRYLMQKRNLLQGKKIEAGNVQERQAGTQEELKDQVIYSCRKVERTLDDLNAHAGRDIHDVLGVRNCNNLVKYSLKGNQREQKETADEMKGLRMLANDILDASMEDYSIDPPDPPRKTLLRVSGVHTTDKDAIALSLNRSDEEVPELAPAEQMLKGMMDSNKKIKQSIRAIDDDILSNRRVFWWTSLTSTQKLKTNIVRINFNARLIESWGYAMRNDILFSAHNIGQMTTAASKDIEELKLLVASEKARKLRLVETRASLDHHVSVLKEKVIGLIQKQIVSLEQHQTENSQCNENNVNKIVHLVKQYSRINPSMKDDCLLVITQLQDQD